MPDLWTSLYQCCIQFPQTHRPSFVAQDFTQLVNHIHPIGRQNNVPRLVNDQSVCLGNDDGHGLFVIIPLVIRNILQQMVNRYSIDSRPYPLVLLVDFPTDFVNDLAAQSLVDKETHVVHFHRFQREPLDTNLGERLE